MPNVRSWPIGLHRLAEVIGPASTVRLAEVYGGIRIYVRATPTVKDPIVQVIGIDKARLLAAEYGGRNLEIPRGAHKDLKKARIIDATGPSRSVAQELGCTHRYVNKVRADLQDNTPQPGLFDPPDTQDAS